MGAPTYRVLDLLNPTADGVMLIGDKAPPNLAIDGDEILARENGAPADLHMNADRGPLALGPV